MKEAWEPVWNTSPPGAAACTSTENCDLGRKQARREAEVPSASPDLRSWGGEALATPIVSMSKLRHADEMAASLCCAIPH